MSEASLPANCPRCGALLRTERHGAIEIDRCDRCGDLWFDRTELVTFFAYYHSGSTRLEWEKKLEPLSSSTLPLECPRCGTASLYSHDFVGLRLNRCSLCYGFHVSREEFERIVAKVGDKPRPTERDNRDYGTCLLVDVLSDFLAMIFKAVT